MDTYFARHRAVYRDRGKAKDHACVRCSITGVAKRALDWAQVHGTCGDDPDHYMPMCRSCHVRYDYTDERRAKAVRGSTGRSYSDETRQKIRLAAKRQWEAGNLAYHGAISQRAHQDRLATEIQKG